jgi:hypothetical protein
MNENTETSITEYVGKHRNINYSCVLPESMFKNIRQNSIPNVKKQKKEYEQANQTLLNKLK